MPEKLQKSQYKSDDWRKEVDKRIDRLLKKDINRFLSSTELYEITTLFEANRNLGA